jgi:hypothetical protein
LATVALCPLAMGYLRAVLGETSRVALRASQDTRTLDNHCATYLPEGYHDNGVLSSPPRNANVPARASTLTPVRPKPQGYSVNDDGNSVDRLSHFVDGSSYSTRRYLAASSLSLFHRSPLDFKLFLTLFLCAFGCLRLRCRQSQRIRSTNLPWARYFFGHLAPQS